MGIGDAFEMEKQISGTDIGKILGEYAKKPKVYVVLHFFRKLNGDQSIINYNIVGAFTSRELADKEGQTYLDHCIKQQAYKAFSFFKDEIKIEEIVVTGLPAGPEA